MMSRRHRRSMERSNVPAPTADERLASLQRAVWLRDVWPNDLSSLSGTRYQAVHRPTGAVLLTARMPEEVALFLDSHPGLDAELRIWR